MKLITYDVELGNSHVLWLPNLAKDVMLFDAGSTGAFSPAEHLRNKWGVKNIRWLNISHQDSDHLTDISNISEFLNTATLSRPSISREELTKHHGGELPATVEVFLAYSEEFNRTCNPIEHPSYDWGGVQFARFKNEQDGTLSLNNLSLVTFISYQGWTFLLPGDLEEKGWLKLLETPNFKEMLGKVDVFVASHHGRASGFCSKVFEYCSPYITIVSDKSNSGTSVAEKYVAVSKGLKIRGFEEPRKVLTTRRDGAIHFEITPEGKYIAETFQTS